MAAYGRVRHYKSKARHGRSRSGWGKRRVVRTVTEIQRLREGEHLYRAYTCVSQTQWNANRCVSRSGSTPTMAMRRSLAALAQKIR
jgi:hypothetical protein